MEVLCCLILALASLHASTGQQVLVRQVRLTNGNATAGRVEVNLTTSNQWGTVCDDDWDDLDARVVCRSLGLTGGVARGRAVYGSGTGPILMDDVFCAGNENSLGECYFTTGSEVNCDHTEDAAVICQPAGASPQPTTTTTTLPGVTLPNNCRQGVNPNPSVQLFGTVPGIGYVQVRAPNGTFGFVCDDGWNTNAAKVVCNELCYDTSLTEPGMKQEYQSRDPNVTFALDDVRCLGNEASLVSCANAGWFVHDCNDEERASVSCITASYPTPPPPQPILECRNGDLIALFNKSRDPKLEPKHLSVANLTAPCNQFSVDDTDPQYMSARIPFEACQTRVEQNATHIIYTNAILMESTSREGAISRINDYIIQLTCEMPRNATVDKNVQPLTETVTQRTEGQFNVTLTIYQDAGFSTPTTTYPFQLTLGQWINAAVELESIDSRLKLVVRDCTALAEPSDPNAPTKPLLVNKCAAELSTLETYMLSQVKVGLRLQSFVFVNYPLVFLECEAIVCLTSEVTEECDRSCNNSKPTPAAGRRRRDVPLAASHPGFSRTVYTVSSQPIHIDINTLSPSTVRTTTPEPLPTTTPTTTRKSPATTTRTKPAATATATTIARTATSSRIVTESTRSPHTVIRVTGTGPGGNSVTTWPPSVPSTQRQQQDAALQAPAITQDNAVSRPLLSVLTVLPVLTALLLCLDLS